MQCKAKGENLAHILGYQTGAVTILHPLQEPRPEILGLSEEGGVLLTKTSFVFPSCFFFSTVRPPEFEELDGAKEVSIFP